MSNHLQDKVLVVTGAGSGFGKLIAEKCASRGAKVVAIDIDAANLASVVDGIRDQGWTALGRVADVADADAMRAAAKAGVSEFGAIDVMVNNAGVMPLAYFSDHEAALGRWHKAIDINIKGVVNGIAAVYDQMIDQGRGHVVNISSIYGNAGIEGSGVYSATKAAVTMLSDSLRTEAKGKIKVTTVKPTGVFDTNLDSWIVNDDAVLGLVAQRSGSFEEHLVAWDAGELSPELTDVDSIRYWLITADDLVTQVVNVIDQPWGISISDITIRASGEDYVY